jgi:hypothetical protein
MDRGYGPSRRALCRRLDAPPDRCGAWGRPQHGGVSAAPRRRQIASRRSTAARRRYATDSGPARSGHVYGCDCCSGGNEGSRGLGPVSAPGSRSGRDTDHDRDRAAVECRGPVARSREGGRQGSLDRGDARGRRRSCRARDPAARLGASGWSKACPRVVGHWLSATARQTRRPDLSREAAPGGR